MKRGDFVGKLIKPKTNPVVVVTGTSFEKGFAAFHLLRTMSCLGRSGVCIARSRPYVNEPPASHGSVLY